MREASCFPAAKSWVPQGLKISAGGDIREGNVGLQGEGTGEGLEESEEGIWDVCKAEGCGLGGRLSSGGRSHLPAPCPSSAPGLSLYLLSPLDPCLRLVRQCLELACLGCWGGSRETFKGFLPFNEADF